MPGPSKRASRRSGWTPLSGSPLNLDPLEMLNAAISKAEYAVSGYRKPVPALMLETLRSIDALFCEKLLVEQALDGDDILYRSLSTWGCNAALSLVMPDDFLTGVYAGHPSNETVQGQADDLLFRCGCIASARRVSGWLHQGLARGTLQTVEGLDGEGPREVLEIEPITDTLWDEDIGLAGLAWATTRVLNKGGAETRRLEREHRRILPELRSSVGVWRGWGLSSTTTPAIDAHFMGWAKLHLEGMYGRDLLDPEDRIGGRPFSVYLDVLTALCARGQKHLAYASILARMHPELDVRNLMTTWSEKGRFIDELTGFLDGDRSEIEDILRDFTLDPTSAGTHLGTSQAAWPPIVQVHEDILFLPLYGLETNPFTFLMRALRSRFEKDWFRIANTRERRWAEELTALFNGPRWHTHGDPLVLREGRKTLTDVDFALYDRKDEVLLLFQLKWQHPVFGDDRARRSAASNLAEEGNRWVETITGWLDAHGTASVLARLGLSDLPRAPRIELIVIGRYAAHFSGSARRDGRAHWTDWSHFRRARVEGDVRSVTRLLAALDRKIAALKRSKRTESLLFPVDDLAVALNARRTQAGYRPQP